MMSQSEDENTEEPFRYRKPLEMLKDKKATLVCAPMVRYSKLAFRQLVRKYGCELTFTPMIVSDSFVKSQKARDVEFVTNNCDRPLIVQFAANNPQDLADAAEIVAPYADGVDLNCGCPQRWAMQEGIGASLITKPELLRDIILQTRNRIPEESFTVSAKIRVHDDLRQTVDMCQKIERAGAAWITVHGRTVDQRNQPVSLEAIRLVKESVSVPVIANGDVKTLSDANEFTMDTGVDGVMSARGILANPAMYAGFEYTPLECVRDWVDLALSLGTPFQIFHHHLMYMLEYVSSKSERRRFNSLQSTTAVLDYLKQQYGI